MPLLLILSVSLISAVAWSGLARRRPSRAVGVAPADEPDDDKHTVVVAIVRDGQIVGYKRVAQGRG